MIKIIRGVRIIRETTYTLRYWHRGHEGNWGFGFPCDADGKVLADKMNPASCQNLEDCRSGKLPVVFGGIERYDHAIREPAVGRCGCGREVYLDGFTCPCECGRDYNWSGQELAPREQWGEETSEDWRDIARIK